MNHFVPLRWVAQYFTHEYTAANTVIGTGEDLQLGKKNTYIKKNWMVCQWDGFPSQISWAKSQLRVVLLFTTGEDISPRRPLRRERKAGSLAPFVKYPLLISKQNFLKNIFETYRPVQLDQTALSFKIYLYISVYKSWTFRNLFKCQHFRSLQWI